MDQAVQKERQAVYGTWLLYQSERRILEYCLLATRGKILERKSRSVSSVIVSHIEEHSKKPDEARARIEALYGEVPKIELFARQTVGGWDCWGNETEKFGRH